MNVFEYECLKATLKPIGIIVQTALIGILITCCIQYEVKQPTLEVSEKTIWETLTILENIDFTGLIYGLALVHVGVLLEFLVFVLYVRTASRTTSPTIHS